MKLNRIFWALMVMALPLSIVACSDKDDDGDDSTPYTFTEPTQKANAATYTVTGQNNNKTRRFIAGEGGDCVIEQYKSLPSQAKGLVTRAEGEEEGTIFIVGKYTTDGTTFTITVGGQVWGTITITNNGNNNYTIQVQEAGQEPEPVVEVAKEAEIEASDLTDKLCRSWKPLYTRLNFKKSTDESWIAKELKGADFEEVKKAVEVEGCHIKDNFGDGYTVSSVFFTKAGTFCIAFTDPDIQSYVGSWQWTDISNGNLTYKWNDESMGCEYEDGTAHVDVYTTDVYKGECWLRLVSTIDNDGTKWDFQLVFRLVDNK